jgi:hypothetical protein
MDAESGKKLKSLLAAISSGGIVTSAKLSELGISHGLARNYVTNGWLHRIGVGAYRRPHENPTWQAAVHALQTQLHLPVHVAALTALAAEGARHYVRLSRDRVFLFSTPQKTSPPRWFNDHDWAADIVYTQSKLLPEELGLRSLDFSGFPLNASSPERAILESLHLAPATIDLVECSHVLEGLLSLRPKLMQELLESCNSIKVRRLFLYLATRSNLPVIKHLDLDRISLGSGARAIVPDGVYEARFQMMLPKELVMH